MKKKSYKITFDLKEGYSETGREHSLQFAEQIIQKWMEARLNGNRPIVAGLLQSGTLFYPLDQKDNKKVHISHSAIFTGELSSPEDMLRKGREVKNTLESLALELKHHLKQKAVFIIYRDKNWSI